jgi:intracellular multiplication protein IcmO
MGYIVMRGIETKHEVNPQKLLRDTRTLGQRMVDFFSDPWNGTVLLGMLAVSIFYLREYSDLLFFIGVCLFWYAATRRKTLPFRLPLIAHAKDYNDMDTAANKPRMSRGIAFFGNDIANGEELWFTNDDMRTHVLIFGSTGAGKTEVLASIAFNALVQGSGFIYIDGKGDNSLFAKIFSMARGMGREDDLLLVNYMTGARDIIGPQEKRLSNTMNPFCRGSSSMLSQLVTSLMDSGSGSGDGDMWKGRAISFVEALMKILVYMRDQGFVLLDANSIRNYFHLPILESIVMDKQFPRDEQESISLESVPALVTEPLKNYVMNLPGYSPDKKGKQVSQVLEQHGFITMQLTRTFSSLADTYGHILRTNLAEVDFNDVILNRRILVVLLPALEKSPEELANLGKLIIASLKVMLAAGLGDSVEGDYRDVIERKPTNAPTPYMCIMDEYGYYAVKGFAVVPAQARSLGFSAIFAGQDLPAFQKASKEEAASIGANTNIKICMKLEDPTETWDFFNKTAGEAYVTKVDSFQTMDNSLTNSYLDSKSSSFEKRARIDLMDLKDQNPGEAHIFFRSKIIRAKMFFANPPKVKVLKLNQFIKVEPPSDDFLRAFIKKMQHFKDILDSGDILITEQPTETEDIDFLADSLQKNEHLGSIQGSVAALLAFHVRSEPEVVEELLEEAVDDSQKDELDIFASLHRSLDATPIVSKDIQAFSQPLLLMAPTRMNMAAVERMSGKQDKHSHNIAVEIVKDMKLATKYPPDVIDTIVPSELSGLVDELIGIIQVARAKAETKE